MLQFLGRVLIFDPFPGRRYVPVLLLPEEELLVPIFVFAFGREELAVLLYDEVTLFGNGALGLMSVRMNNSIPFAIDHRISVTIENLNQLLFSCTDPSELT